MCTRRMLWPCTTVFCHYDYLMQLALKAASATAAKDFVCQGILNCVMVKIAKYFISRTGYDEEVVIRSRKKKNGDR